MRYLFEFATKELSQDAFLRWLFENYNCENSEIKKYAYGLLNRFNKLNMEIGDIEELETFGQHKDIDVIVKFRYQGNTYLTVIEDKTFSSTHGNQLEKYNEILKKKETLEYFNTTAERTAKIFYKTDIENASDKAACEKSKWTPFFLDKIRDMFNSIHNQTKTSSTGSEILDGYLFHLKALYDRTSMVSNKPMSQWEDIDFRTFVYEKVLKGNKDKRMEKVYDVQYYHYCTFNLAYFIPNTFNRIYVSIEFRDKLKFYLRISKCDPNKVGDVGRADASTEAWVKEKFIISEKYFSRCDSSAKHYLLFAKQNESMNKRLEYSNNPDDVACALKEMLSEFADQCEKLNLSVGVK